MRMGADRAIDVRESARRWQAIRRVASPASRSSPCGQRRRPPPAPRCRRDRRQSPENPDGNGCRRAWETLKPRTARHNAETPPAVPASSCPAAMRVLPPSAANIRASPSGMPRLSSSFARGRRHHRLGQDRDLPHDFRGDIEHRALPRRIGLGQRPWRLAREIAVGFGDHRPHRVEPLMDLLRRHRLARERDHAVGLRQDRLVVIAELARRPAARRRAVWRSSTASAAPDCRDRWRDRH